MDALNHHNSMNDLGRKRGDGENSATTIPWKEMSHEEKTAAVHAEIERVNQLPSRSSYASHRMRVLHQLLRLLSIKRTRSQEEELELLFAGLSL